MKDNVLYEKIETEYQSPFRVVEINITPENQSEKKRKHWHRSLEFIVPFENGCEVWIEGELSRYYGGEMCLVNSRQIHEGEILNTKEPYKGYSVQLKYDFLVEAIPEIDQYTFTRYYNKEEHLYMFELIDKIINTYKNKNKFQYLRLQSLAYELCYELFTNYIVDKQNNKVIANSKNKTRLIEVLNYLDKNSAEQFDATQIADYFHVSYGHLAKLFKAELGMSMKEYVNGVRLRKATFDLLTTKMPITDIAIQHGFVSSKAFYKEFEKVYHMTPKQYRTKI